MTTSARAQWLLERHSLWHGMSPREVVLGDLSARVVDLITGMRDDGLFPDWWDEHMVLQNFLAAVNEARASHRRQYADAVRQSDESIPEVAGRPYAHKRTGGRRGWTS